tara:strand:- start:6292 stop:6657 length:366 start_codon:yes stop_codon:yes gene_type:complete
MTTKRGSTPVRSEEHNSYFQAGYTKCSQYVSFTGTVSKSAILDDETSIVELFATQDCWVSVIGNADTPPTKPSAEKTTVSNIKLLRGGIVGFIGVPPSILNPVVAVVRDDTSGTLDITEYD